MDARFKDVYLMLVDERGYAHSDAVMLIDGMTERDVAWTLALAPHPDALEAVTDYIVSGDLHFIGRCYGCEQPYEQCTCRPSQAWELLNAERMAASRSVRATCPSDPQPRHPQ
jgi:hypothetical protein